MRRRGRLWLLRAWKAAKYRASLFNRHYSETLMGFFLIQWGIRFITDRSIFDTTPLWGNLAIRMDETVFGLFALVLGLTWLYMLGTASRQGRQTVSFMALGWWSFVLLVTIPADGWDAVVFINFAIYCFWTYVRIGQSEAEH